MYSLISQNSSDSFERVLKHDRVIVLSALTLVLMVAWIYTLAGIGMSMNAFEMSGMSNLIATDIPLIITYTSWDGMHFIFMLAMWWLMMIAMMLPSAAPTILLTAALNRRSKAEKSPYGKTGFFAAGYLIVWLGFSLIAVFCQWVLEHNGFINNMMQNSSNILAASLLIMAGTWQYTPIKQACLRHCRSPVDFLTRNRRPGNQGAFIMGLHHGAYCLGCCWFLMGLLFVVCIMNVYWIIGLTLFVLVEKLFSKGPLFGQVSGIVMIMVGILLLRI